MHCETFDSVYANTHKLMAVDYLGSRGAGLLIATQKLMLVVKMEKTDKKQLSEKGLRRKAGESKSHP